MRCSLPEFISMRVRYETLQKIKKKRVNARFPLNKLSLTDFLAVIINDI